MWGKGAQRRGYCPCRGWARAPAAGAGAAPAAAVPAGACLSRLLLLPCLLARLARRLGEGAVVLDAGAVPLQPGREVALQPTLPEGLKLLQGARK